MKLAALLAVGVLAALPWIVSSYAVTVLIFIFFYAYLGQAWNIVGGYAAALLSMHAGLTPWLGMWIGGMLAAALGAFVGYLGFRFGLRG
ncbi:MAG TPA: branched-chain amino acid ABC transporter permease, partial [Methylomirabilota bacterium]